MEYTKDFKERGELLQQLEARGLAIPERAAELDFLTREVRLRAAIAHTFAAKNGTSSYMLLWAQQHDILWAFAVYAAVLSLISIWLYRLAARKGQVHIGNRPNKTFLVVLPLYS